VIHALKVWRMYLVGGPVTVRTDHAALKWFNTQPKLSQRQAWSIALQEHNVQSKVFAGKSNVVADALSRRPDLQLEACAIQLRRRTRQGSYLHANEEEFGSINRVDPGSEPAPDLADTGNESVEAQPGSPKGATILPEALLGAVRAAYRAQKFEPCQNLQGTFELSECLWLKRGPDGCPGWSSRMMPSFRKTSFTNYTTQERLYTWDNAGPQNRWHGISGGLA
jgi:hypothetical protein